MRSRTLTAAPRPPAAIVATIDQVASLWLVKSPAAQSMSAAIPVVTASRQLPRSIPPA